MLSKVSQNEFRVDTSAVKKSAKVARKSPILKRDKGIQGKDNEEASSKEKPSRFICAKKEKIMKS